MYIGSDFLLQNVLFRILCPPCSFRVRFATSTVGGFAVARRDACAPESIGNGLRMYFLVGFMLQRPGRLQIVAENDHFAYRPGSSSSSSEDLDRRSGPEPEIWYPSKIFGTTMSSS